MTCVKEDKKYDWFPGNDMLSFLLLCREWLRCVIISHMCGPTHTASYLWNTKTVIWTQKENVKLWPFSWVSVRWLSWLGGCLLVRWWFKILQSVPVEIHSNCCRQIAVSHRYWKQLARFAKLTAVTSCSHVLNGQGCERYQSSIQSLVKGANNCERCF